jgi:hypothetical protein
MKAPSFFSFRPGFLRRQELPGPRATDCHAPLLAEQFVVRGACEISYERANNQQGFAVQLQYLYASKGNRSLFT